MRCIRVCTVLLAVGLLAACSESATGPTDSRFGVEPAFSHSTTTTIELGSALVWLPPRLPPRLLGILRIRS